MSEAKPLKLACVAFCLMLMACAATPSRSNPADLYALPVLGGAHRLPVDNDSYYTQPGSYNGCAQINDAPSCGGG